MNARRILITVLAVGGLTGAAGAGLVLDPDTGKWIQEGFDIRAYATVPGEVLRMAFGPGGAFGNGLYVGSYGKIYRVDSGGQIDLFAELPVQPNGLAFPNAGSGFGDYLYVGSGDSYWGGNRNIYRISPSGTVETFWDGGNYLGGTMGMIRFAPPGSPYGNYLFTQDDNPDQIYRIDPSGGATPFSSGIPLAVDFVFDTYGHFENKLLVINKEKSEHGSSYNTIYKVAIDGSKTVLLGDAFTIGGGDLTPPSSPFGGRLFVVEDYWPSQPTDLYWIGRDGSAEVFARGFDFWDESGVVYGPDGAIYVGDRRSGVIYQILPEPAAMSLLAIGALAVLRRRGGSHAFS